MRLIIIRHGETVENVKGIIQSHLPGKLNARGKEQARKVAKRLKNCKIDFIYSSDLARAADTAKEIARYHKNTPIKFVKELRERNLGEFQGKEKAKINWKNKRKKYQRFTVRPKGGESWMDICNRAKKFFYKILHKHKQHTVLFVCHGGISRALICVITNKPPEEMFNFVGMNHTGISIFEIDEGKNHKILLFNCIKHLDKV